MEHQYTIKFPEYDTHERTIYRGQVYNGTMHGFGTLKWKDGSTYEGYWVQNVQNGFGTFTYPKSSIVHQYRGRWQNGRRHGDGIVK